MSTLVYTNHQYRVSGCVGFANYKFFYLFVLYTGCYGLWVFVSSLPLVITGVKDRVSYTDKEYVLDFYTKVIVF